jgi:hypothetical protein
MFDTVLCDEPARLAAPQRLNVLDIAVEEPFEKIVMLVRTVLGVPIATVTIVDRDHQWFKAKRGLDAGQSGLSCVKLSDMASTPTCRRPARILRHRRSSDDAREFARGSSITGS